MTRSTLPGMVLSDRTFSVPLDHARPDGERIDVFARDVRAVGAEDEGRPWLVFLQGGPGFESPRPPAGAAWLPRALEEYHVLLLDQRGTGRSGRLEADTLSGSTPEEVVARLALYRMDAIVEDCEAIRREVTGGAPWTVLGQSYGGFCATRYLSAHPEGLAAALITGGLPPLDAHPDDIYRQTYARCREKNEAYYARYPDDVERVREIVTVLGAASVELPSGGVLSPRRFQQLGLALGMGDGRETLHYLVEDAFVAAGASGRRLGFHFLVGVDRALSYPTHPLFSILHEPIYCQGFASRWAAERVRAEFPEFDVHRADGPVLFTGEMIYPWMFEEVERLRPLRAAAELLAAKDDWPVLYDRDQLARNDVPVAAALYHDDMYVDRSFSLETAKAIRGARVWVTNEHEHDGLRVAGAAVLARLLDMAHGRA